uniref:Growth-regulating factor n=1 Tax=Musa acuminata subsp. malaccensis TaxID=214687 RepID=A0A804K2Z4_MUSAM|nr:PREDICTED: growth-regulating factor 6-like isoform X1 [Musa acuminata subsp. malaccensis]
MDFGGVLGMDALVGASSEGGGSLFSSSFTTSLAPSDTELGRQGGLRGSILQKHDRPAAEPEDCDWRSLKMARPEELVTAPTKAAPFLLRSNSHPLFPDGEQMLSFSSASPPSTTQCYIGNAGSSPGSSNASMQGVLARLRGPFTPSQWLELEHQALIYKYLVANVPIPATLLIPIRRSLGASGFPPLSAGSFGSVGWEPFHLGYSGNADPEPGRCRRTDGKKWRCSRDAVADQKYCERHMNRGRHRSRKHVENQTGNAAKAMPTTASSQSASAVLGGASTNTLTISLQQSKSLQSNITDPCPLQFNGLLMSKGDHNVCSLNSKSLSAASPVNQKPDSDILPPVSDQHNPFEETSSRTEFGLVSPDSLLNPPSISFSNNVNFMATPKLNEQQIQSHPFRHFIDDWPKTQSDRSTITWPEVDKTQSDRTQLSISIPTAYSDFSSSSCNHDKPALSKLSREYDAIHMPSRQANWRPIPWEASMAGPLGEVLTSTKSTPKDQSKNHSSSSLNLLTEGWDSRLESSPTGVLHKTSFGSLSNSTGSSPSAENSKTHDSTGSLCSGLLGSTL